MKILTQTAALALVVSAEAYATGLATCNSGPQESWQPQAKLEQMLKECPG